MKKPKRGRKAKEEKRPKSNVEKIEVKLEKKDLQIKSTNKEVHGSIFFF